MGPLKNVLGMLGMADVPKEFVEQGEERLKKYEVMIGSMTRDERDDVALIKKSSSRQARIARGAGVQVEDVRKLISEFEKMEKLMGRFKKDRGKPPAAAEGDLIAACPREHEGSPSTRPWLRGVKTRIGSIPLRSGDAFFRERGRARVFRVSTLRT